MAKSDYKAPKMNFYPERSHYFYKILRSRASLMRTPGSITTTAGQNGYLDVCGGWRQRIVLVTSLSRLKVTNSMMLLNQCSRPESGTSLSLKRQNHLSYIKIEFLILKMISSNLVKVLF